MMTSLCSPASCMFRRRSLICDAASSESSRHGQPAQRPMLLLHAITCHPYARVLPCATILKASRSRNMATSRVFKLSWLRLRACWLSCFFVAVAGGFWRIWWFTFFEEALERAEKIQELLAPWEVLAVYKRFLEGKVIFFSRGTDAGWHACAGS